MNKIKITREQLENNFEIVEEELNKAGALTDGFIENELQAETYIGDIDKENYLAIFDVYKGKLLNVDGDVNLSGLKIIKFPFAFGYVTGDYNVKY